MYITTYSYSKEGLTQLMNQGMDLFVAGLVTEGFIEKESAEKICSEYGLVIRSRNFFGKLLDRFWKKDKDAVIVTFVKIVETDTMKELWEDVED